MKRILTIFLVFLMLFNVMGFYALFLGIKYSNHQRMVKSFNTDSYNEDQTTLIKIPVSIPYYPDQTEFTRVDGDFEHKGEFYKLVKQKYAGDTLYIICIRDTRSENIHYALKDYVKTFADTAGSDHKSSKNQTLVLKDYLISHFTIESSIGWWQREALRSSFATTFLPTFVVSIVHPPERA